MEMSLEPFQVVGRKILISDTYTLIVTQACNGMVPLWMFYASILAVRTAWVYQLKWMVAGYITIFVVNVFRIWFVAFFAKEMGQSSFFLAHDLVGNIILIVTGTLLFFIYLRHLPKGEKLKL
jgi:exosortase/archaeosortase family protein